MGGHKFSKPPFRNRDEVQCSREDNFNIERSSLILGTDVNEVDITYVMGTKHPLGSPPIGPLKPPRNQGVPLIARSRDRVAVANVLAMSCKARLVGSLSSYQMGRASPAPWRG